ncbi:MAG: hypothetical protein HY765_05330 [Rhodomicrobium sp.]|nr:hypothetical protein [Rhodomicrobium sp.]
MECIGKGKAHKPYEFGVKASLATTVSPSKGGQFIVHAKTLPGNPGACPRARRSRDPRDGHTLKTVIPDIEATTGAAVARILADAGYKGHNAPKEHKFRVHTQGQKRGSRKRSSASSNAAPPSNPSSAMPRKTIAWAGTTSPITKAMPPTPFSPPPHPVAEAFAAHNPAGPRIRPAPLARVKKEVHGRRSIRSFIEVSADLFRSQG